MIWDIFVPLTEPCRVGMEKARREKKRQRGEGILILEKLTSRREHR